ncbi:hypothetical protein [Actinoallomurus iriomotensis]|nr:hypothetical protein [Actinoallomurus iriomotensis]
MDEAENLPVPVGRQVEEDQVITTGTRDREQVGTGRWSASRLF